MTVQGERQRVCVCVCVCMAFSNIYTCVSVCVYIYICLLVCVSQNMYIVCMSLHRIYEKKQTDTGKKTRKSLRKKSIRRLFSENSFIQLRFHSSTTSLSYVPLHILRKAVERHMLESICFIFISFRVLGLTVREHPQHLFDTPLRDVPSANLILCFLDNTRLHVVPLSFFSILILFLAKCRA